MILTPEKLEELMAVAKTARQILNFWIEADTIFLNGDIPGYKINVDSDLIEDQYTAELTRQFYMMLDPPTVIALLELAMQALKMREALRIATGRLGHCHEMEWWVCPEEWFNEAKTALQEFEKETK